MGVELVVEDVLRRHQVLRASGEASTSTSVVALSDTRQEKLLPSQGQEKKRPLPSEPSSSLLQRGASRNRKK